MTTIAYSRVHSFTAHVAGGNPAGVCTLDDALPDATMQLVARENGLSETAFTVPRGGDFELRWFTPEVEVDLCGHATLAAAFVLLEREPGRESVRFHSRSGELIVTRCGSKLEMDFPAHPPRPEPAGTEIAAALGGSPTEILRGELYSLVVYGSERELAALQPDCTALAAAEPIATAATAPGDTCDFVSRFFAPAVGIDEDPVTGSAHCMLAPYWAQRLGRSSLTARQISARGGDVECEVRGSRVALRGAAVLYQSGTLTV